MINVYYTVANNFELLYAESKEGGSMPSLHTHNHYEIYYLNEGKRSYIIDNKVYDMVKGSVALIPPNIFHKTSGGSHTRTLVSFSSQYLNNCFKDNVTLDLLSCFSTPVILLSEEEQKITEDILRRMSDNKDSCGYDTRPILLAALLTLLNSHSANEKYMPRMTSDSLLSQILDYISKNYLEIKSLDEISQKFFLTKFHLCRIFIENTGMSIFSYLNLLKLHASCELLLTTDNSITDISLECGFNSHAYYCKTFNKQFGMSPMAYRKKHSSVK